MRLLSLLTSLSFLLPSLTWAFDPQAYRIGQLPSVFFQQHEVLIPESHGRITDGLQAGDRLVVLIQDLHCNYEVQMNIAHIVDTLAAKIGLRLVTLEGAAHPINVTKLSTFPVREVKEFVGRTLVRQGQIGGPEYYAAVGSRPVRLEGVEDPELYLKNLATVRGFLNSESQGAQADLRDALEALKPGIYSAELARFDQARVSYREGERSLEAYAVELADRARALGIRGADHPNLWIYLQAPKSVFPVALDQEELYRELDRLDRQVREAMYTAPEQRRLDEMLRRLDLVERLINISALPEEVAEFRAARERFSVEAFRSFLREQGPEDASELDPEIFRLDQYLGLVDDFYRVAEERSSALTKNVLRAMERRGEKAAVLVTGGYHTVGITQALRAQGISYVTVLPRLTRQDVVNPYFDLLQERRTPLEKLLLKNQNLFAVPLNSAQVRPGEEEVVLNEAPGRLEDHVVTPGPSALARVRLHFSLAQVLFEMGSLEHLARSGDQTSFVRRLQAMFYGYPANFNGPDVPDQDLTPERLARLYDVLQGRGGLAIVKLEAERLNVVLCGRGALQDVTDRTASISGRSCDFVVMTDAQLARLDVGRYAGTGPAVVLNLLRSPQNVFGALARRFSAVSDRRQQAWLERRTGPAAARYRFEPEVPARDRAKIILANERTGLLQDAARLALGVQGISTPIRGLTPDVQFTYLGRGVNKRAYRADVPVVLADGRRLTLPVTVKVPHPGLGLFVRGVQRAWRSWLRGHPFVPVFFLMRRGVIAQEYVPGRPVTRSLNDLDAADRRRTVREAVRAYVGLLVPMWRAGRTHWLILDPKPQNIILRGGPENGPKIIDLGAVQRMPFRLPPFLILVYFAAFYGTSALPVAQVANNVFSPLVLFIFLPYAFLVTPEPGMFEGFLDAFGKEVGSRFLEQAREGWSFRLTARSPFSRALSAYLDAGSREYRAPDQPVPMFLPRYRYAPEEFRETGAPPVWVEPSATEGSRREERPEAQAGAWRDAILLNAFASLGWILESGAVLQRLAAESWDELSLVLVRLLEVQGYWEHDLSVIGSERARRILAAVTDQLRSVENANASRPSLEGLSFTVLDRAGGRPDYLEADEDLGRLGVFPVGDRIFLTHDVLLNLDDAQVTALLLYAVLRARGQDHTDAAGGVLAATGRSWDDLVQVARLEEGSEPVETRNLFRYPAGLQGRNPDLSRTWNDLFHFIEGLEREEDLHGILSHYEQALRENRFRDRDQALAVLTSVLTTVWVTGDLLRFTRLLARVGRTCSAYFTREELEAVRLLASYPEMVRPAEGLRQAAVRHPRLAVLLRGIVRNPAYVPFALPPEQWDWNLQEDLRAEILGALPAGRWAGALLGRYGESLLGDILNNAGAVLQPGQTVVEWAAAAGEGLGEVLARVWARFQMSPRPFAESAGERGPPVRAALTAQLAAARGAYRDRVDADPSVTAALDALTADTLDLRVLTVGAPQGVPTDGDLERLGVFHLGRTTYLTAAVLARVAEDEALAAILLHETLETAGVPHDLATVLVRQATVTPARPQGFTNAELIAAAGLKPSVRSNGAENVARLRAWIGDRVGLVITIDGPAAGGKSEISEALAAQLGFLAFDVGSVFRAITWLALQKGISLNDGQALAEVARKAGFETQPVGARLALFAGAENLAESSDLRRPEVSQQVAVASRNPEVQEFVQTFLKAQIADRNVVVEGRNMGADVFPQAWAKFFLEPSLERRVERRREEYRELGVRRSAGRILREIAKRDRLDRERLTSPLRPAVDAEIIDTTDLDNDDVTAILIESLAASKLPPPAGVEDAPDPGLAGDGRAGTGRAQHLDLHRRMLSEPDLFADLARELRSLGLTAEQEMTAEGDARYRLREALEAAGKTSVRTAHGELRLESDGILTIIDDRFGADHAGRDQWAVYARNEAKARHELVELRRLAQWLEVRGVVARGQSGPGGKVGTSFRLWLQGVIQPDSEVRQLETRRNLALAAIELFHSEGLAAEFATYLAFAEEAHAAEVKAGVAQLGHLWDALRTGSPVIGRFLARGPQGLSYFLVTVRGDEGPRAMVGLDPEGRITQLAVPVTDADDAFTLVPGGLDHPLVGELEAILARRPLDDAAQNTGRAESVELHFGLVNPWLGAERLAKIFRDSPFLRSCLMRAGPDAIRALQPNIIFRDVEGDAPKPVLGLDPKTLDGIAGGRDRRDAGEAVVTEAIVRQQARRLLDAVPMARIESLRGTVAPAMRWLSRGPGYGHDDEERAYREAAAEYLTALALGRELFTLPGPEGRRRIFWVREEGREAFLQAGLIEAGPSYEPVAYEEQALDRMDIPISGEGPSGKDGRRERYGRQGAGTPASGQITYLAMVHETATDFEALRPDLEQARKKALAQHRPFGVLTDFGGPTWPDLDPPMEKDEAVELARRDPDTLRALRDYFERNLGQAVAEFRGLAQGRVSASLKGVKADSFSGALIAWAGKGRVPVLLEEISFEDWLDYHRADGLRMRARQLILATGLRTEQDQRRYEALMDEYVAANSRVMARRNQRILTRTERISQAGTSAVLIYGTSHRRILEALQSRDLPVRRGKASLDQRVADLFLGVEGLGGRVAAGELPDPAQRRSAYYQDAVMSALLVLSKRMGRSDTMRNFEVTGGIARRWTVPEVMDLCQALAEETRRPGAALTANLLTRWLLEHGTEQERAFFGLTAGTEPQQGPAAYGTLLGSRGRILLEVMLENVLAVLNIPVHTGRPILDFSRYAAQEIPRVVEEFLFQQRVQGRSLDGFEKQRLEATRQWLATYAGRAATACAADRVLAVHRTAVENIRPDLLPLAVLEPSPEARGVRGDVFRVGVFHFFNTLCVTDEVFSRVDSSTLAAILLWELLDQARVPAAEADALLRQATRGLAHPEGLSHADLVVLAGGGSAPAGISGPSLWLAEKILNWRERWTSWFQFLRGGGRARQAAVGPPPASFLLKALGLDQAGAIPGAVPVLLPADEQSALAAAGLRVERIQMEGPASESSMPSGPEILRRQLLIRGQETGRFDLVWSSDGARLLAVFPVEEGTQAQKNASTPRWDYLDLSPYHLSLPAPAGRAAEQAWEDFGRRLSDDTAQVQAYKLARFGPAAERLVHAINPSEAYVSVRVSKVTGRLSVQPLYPGSSPWTKAGFLTAQFVVPVLPTVYTFNRFLGPDRQYYEQVYRYLSAGTPVTVLGSGSGIDAGLAWLRTGRRVEAYDLNPLARANTEAMAALNGIPLRVHATRPETPSGLVIWNMPAYTETLSRPEGRAQQLQDVWDRDLDGKTFRDLVRYLAHNGRSALIWNETVHHGRIADLASEAGLILRRQDRNTFLLEPEARREEVRRFAATRVAPWLEPALALLLPLGVGVLGAVWVPQFTLALLPAALLTLVGAAATAVLAVIGFLVQHWNGVIVPNSGPVGTWTMKFADWRTRAGWTGGRGRLTAWQGLVAPALVFVAPVAALVGIVAVPLSLAWLGPVLSVPVIVGLAGVGFAGIAAYVRGGFRHAEYNESVLMRRGPPEWLERVYTALPGLRPPRDTYPLALAGTPSGRRAGPLARQAARYTWRSGLDLPPVLEERIRRLVTTDQRDLQEGIDYDRQEGRNLYLNVVKVLGRPWFVDEREVRVIKIKGVWFNADETLPPYEGLYPTVIRFGARGQVTEQFNPEKKPTGAMTLTTAENEYLSSLRANRGGAAAAVALGYTNFDPLMHRDPETGRADVLGAVILGLEHDDEEDLRFALARLMGNVDTVRSTVAFDLNDVVRNHGLIQVLVWEAGRAYRRLNDAGVVQEMSSLSNAMVSPGAVQGERVRVSDLEYSERLEGATVAQEVAYRALEIRNFMTGLENTFRKGQVRPGLDRRDPRQFAELPSWLDDFRGVGLDLATLFMLGYLGDFARPGALRYSTLADLNDQVLLALHEDPAVLDRDPLLLSLKDMVLARRAAVAEEGMPDRSGPPAPSGPSPFRDLNEAQAQELAVRVNERIGGGRTWHEEAGVAVSGEFLDARGLRLSRTLRVGPFVLVMVNRTDPAILTRELASLRARLGSTYEESSGNILFANSSEFDENRRFPLSDLTISVIQAMVRHADELSGATLLDAGAYDGILARVALRLGAAQAALSEQDRVQAELSRVFLRADGWREGEDADAQVRVQTRTLTGQETVTELLGGLRSDRPLVALMNFGTYYWNVNLALTRALARWPRVRAIFNGGHVIGGGAVRLLDRERTQAIGDLLRQEAFDVQSTVKDHALTWIARRPGAGPAFSLEVPGGDAEDRSGPPEPLNWRNLPGVYLRYLLRLSALGLGAATAVLAASGPMSPLQLGSFLTASGFVALGFSALLLPGMLIHELGHYLAIRVLLHRDPRLVVVKGRTFWTLQVEYADAPVPTPGQEIMIALSGPLVSLVFWSALIAFGVLGGAVAWPASLMALVYSPALMSLVLMGIYTSILQLLPLSGFDGLILVRTIGRKIMAELSRSLSSTAGQEGEPGPERPAPPTERPLDARQSLRMAARVGFGDLRAEYGLLGSVLGSGVFLAAAAAIGYAKLAVRLGLPRLGKEADLAAYREMPSPRRGSVCYEQGGVIFLDKEAMLRLPRFVRELFILHERAHAERNADERQAYRAMVEVVTGPWTRFRARYQAFAAEHPGQLYLLNSAGLILVAQTVIGLGVMQWTTDVLVFNLLTFLSLGLLNASIVDDALALFLVNRRKPLLLPGVDVSAGIPDEFRTVAYFPILFKNEAQIDEIEKSVVDSLENNPDQNIKWVVLSTSPPDIQALERVRFLALQERFGADRIFYVHRAPEAGNWEKKRGGYMHFMLWLEGSLRPEGTIEPDPRFPTLPAGKVFDEVLGEVEALRGTRFFAIGDSDTVWLPDTLPTLVSKMAHPDNRSYVIFQGRTTPSNPESTLLNSAINFFNMTFARRAEKIWTSVRRVAFWGHGAAWDLHRFLDGMTGNIRAGFLSHDIPETFFARTALVVEVATLEEYPDNIYLLYKQLERWWRGTKMTSIFFERTIPNERGEAVPNPLEAEDFYILAKIFSQYLIPPVFVLFLIVTDPVRYQIIPGLFSMFLVFYYHVLRNLILGQGWEKLRRSLQNMLVLMLVTPTVTMMTTVFVVQSFLSDRARQLGLYRPHRRTEWVVQSSLGKPNMRTMLRQMLPFLLINIATGILGWVLLNPFLTAPLFYLPLILSPLVIWFTALPPERVKRWLTLVGGSMRRSLRGYLEGGHGFTTDPLLARLVWQVQDVESDWNWGRFGAQGREKEDPRRRLHAGEAVRMAARVGFGDLRAEYGLLGSVLGSGVFLAAAAAIGYAKLAVRLGLPRLGKEADLAAYREMPSPRRGSVCYEQGGVIFLDKEAMLRLPRFVREIFILHERAHAERNADERQAYRAMVEAVRAWVRPAPVADREEGVPLATAGLGRFDDRYNRPADRAQDPRALVRLLNSLGLTGLLFPMVSALQVTLGSLRVRAAQGWTSLAPDLGALVTGLKGRFRRESIVGPKLGEGVRSEERPAMFFGPPWVLGSIFGDTVLGRAARQWALASDRGAYLRAQVRSARFSSALGRLMEDRLPDLLSRGQGLDLNTFQKLTLAELVDILRTNPPDAQMCADVIVFMNEVAPLAGVPAGTLEGREFRLPKLFVEEMGRDLGALLDQFRRFPERIMPRQDLEDVIPQRNRRSTAQAA